MISVVDIVERSSVGRLEQPFTTKENQMDAPPFEDDDYTAMAWPARIDHIQPGQKIAMWYASPTTSGSWARSPPCTLVAP